MKIFILEDEITKFPRNMILTALKDHTLTIAQTSFEAIQLYKPSYDLLLLDHDMRGFYDDPEFEDTGYQFVKWLVTKELGVKPEVILHSQNYEGRRAMGGLLYNAGFKVQEMPFSPNYVTYLNQTYGRRKETV